MDAYKLADIVDRWAYKEGEEYLTDAANMLRQQATLVEYYKVRDDSHQKIIAELEKQQKPLSDEEIDKIYQEVWNSNKWSDVEGIDIEKFARAIEERHGIK